MHDAVKPIGFLIGKWKSFSANGKFPPRVDPFTYKEELEFTSMGQPMLNYKSTTWHPESGKPMHLEVGFLKVKPGTKDVAFIVAHNFGITSVEEGVVFDDNSIKVKGTKISRAEMNKEPSVTEIQRTIELKQDGRLQIIVSMSTSLNDNCEEHLVVVYEKVDG